MKIYITGVSGTGKTTIANQLIKRGINTISIDETDDLCCWENRESGKKVDGNHVLNKEFIDAHNWVCDINYLEKLIQENPGNLVVLGIASNQNTFLNLFDKILLLQCKPETFIKRIEEREDNDFGKDKSAQESILSWYKDFENKILEKGAIPINTERPLNEVIENILGYIK